MSLCRVNLPATRSAGFQTSLQGSDLCCCGTPVALTSAELIHPSFLLTQLSAHPAPPAAATAQVLGKTRWQQWPLTMFLKHICLVSILRVGGINWGINWLNVRKENLPHTGYSPKAVAAGQTESNCSTTYKAQIRKTIFFFTPFLPCNLLTLNHDHWLWLYIFYYSKAQGWH